jgi:hypothetical protein
LISPPPVISHARATPFCLRSTEPRVGSRLRRMPAPHGRYGPACRVSPGPLHGLPCVLHHHHRCRQQFRESVVGPPCVQRADLVQLRWLALGGRPVGLHRQRPRAPTTVGGRPHRGRSTCRSTRTRRSPAPRPGSGSASPVRPTRRRIPRRGSRLCRGPRPARGPCGGSPGHHLALWPARTDLPDQAGTRTRPSALVLEGRVRRDDRGDAAARRPAQSTWGRPGREVAPDGWLPYGASVQPLVVCRRCGLC